MKVQVNTDNHIEGHERLAAHVTSVVENALRRSRDHITRVEVHLSDENSAASAHQGKRCVMEARFEGRPPVAVTHHADNLDQAVEGAARKIKAALESMLGRLSDHHRHPAPAADSE